MSRISHEMDQCDSLIPVLKVSHCEDTSSSKQDTEQNTKHDTIVRKPRKTKQHITIHDAIIQVLQDFPEYTREELQEYLNFFNLFDVEKKGTLNEREVISLIRSLGRSFSTASQKLIRGVIEDIFEEVQETYVLNQEDFLYVIIRVKLIYESVGSIIKRQDSKIYQR
jgi:hypothetical protein